MVQIGKNGIKQDGQDEQDKKRKHCCFISLFFILPILSILFISFSLSNSTTNE
jgi:hypothetical protein